MEAFACRIINNFILGIYITFRLVVNVEDDLALVLDGLDLWNLVFKTACSSLLIKQVIYILMLLFPLRRIDEHPFGFNDFPVAI